jgi:DNA-binding winged helix-turn-helix (wHTH) protein
MQQIEITKAYLPENPPMKGFLKVGNHVVDCGALRVITKAPMCSLPPKSIHVLYELAKNAGDTVSRDELMATVWPEKTTPASDVVKQAIMGLRRTFDTQSSSKSVIETIPRTGYRLVAGCYYSEDLANLGSLGKEKKKRKKIQHPAAEQRQIFDLEVANTNKNEIGFRGLKFISIKTAKLSFLFFFMSAVIIIILR